MDLRDPPGGEGWRSNPTVPPTGRTGEPVTGPTQPATEPASARRPSGLAGTQRVWRWPRRILLGLVVLAGLLLAQIFVYRFAMPAWTPTMAVSWLMGEPVVQQWVPLRRISPQLIRAVIVSEDARFCVHHGIDFGELKAAIEEARGGASPRGASTITMQVVKNVFLWPSKSYLRKALEVPLTYLMEFVWPKQRIIEVYLNIAEFGDGIYGVAAASERYFGVTPAQLSTHQAALLAAVLPNPRRLHADRPSPYVQRRANWIERQVRQLGGPGYLDP